MRPAGASRLAAPLSPTSLSAEVDVGKSSANVPRRVTELGAGTRARTAVVLPALTETFRLRHRANFTAVPAKGALLKFSPSAQA